MEKPRSRDIRGFSTRELTNSQNTQRIGCLSTLGGIARRSWMETHFEIVGFHIREAPDRVAQGFHNQGAEPSAKPTRQKTTGS